MLWVAALVLDLSGRAFPVGAFVTGLLVIGGSLPTVARRPGVRSSRLATAGTVLVVVAHALALLFNQQLVLLLAGWAGVAVTDAAVA